MILASPEYNRQASTLFSSTPDDNYIQALYVHLLGREGAAAERSFWLKQLPIAGPAAVALGIMTSPEFRANAVAGFYADILHPTTRPADADVAFWANSGLDVLRMDAIFAGFSYPGFNAGLGV